MSAGYKKFVSGKGPITASPIAVSTVSANKIIASSIKGGAFGHLKFDRGIKFDVHGIEVTLGELITFFETVVPKDTFETNIIGQRLLKKEDGDA